MMKNKGLEKPRNIMFSGTGSKILNIIADKAELDMLTQVFIEKIYDEKFGEDGFSIITRENDPKQITCRGALMQVKDEEGISLINDINKHLDIQ